MYCCLIIADFVYVVNHVSAVNTSAKRCVLHSCEQMMDDDYMKDDISVEINTSQTIFVFVIEP